MKTKRMKNIAIAALSLTMVAAMGFGVSSLSANADMNSSEIISRVKGAAARVESETDSGLRFYTEIDMEKFNLVKDTADWVFGTIIVPTEYVSEAGGYTYEALTAKYGVDGILNKQYTEAEIVESGKNIYAASIVNIKPKNYTRDFIAISYMYDGNSYQYAEYDEENQSRSIYEVATMAFESDMESEEAKAFCKTYMDGVVDITNTAGVVAISNNTSDYISPYTVEKDSRGAYIVKAAAGVDAKSVLYNGERKTEFNITDGETQIAVMESNKSTFNADGSVSLNAGVLGGSSTAQKYGTNENGYVAFEGNYGVNTYVETTFSISTENVGSTATDYGHDNIPQIILFADNIDGKEYAGKGLMLSTGMGDYGNAYGTNWWKTFKVFGPDRPTSTSTYNGGAIAQTTDYPLLTQKGLREDLNNTLDEDATNDVVKTYKYIVGTFYNSNGNLVVDVTLLVKDGDAWAELQTAEGKSYTNIYFVTTLTKTDVATMGTNVILFAEHKGKVYKPTTTFTYSAPYTYTYIPMVVATKGVTENADGSITMKAKTAGALVAKGVGTWHDYMSYYAYQGDYGVGYYVDVAFTGYMPQFIFFAKNSDTITTGYASVSTYGTGTNSGNAASYGRKGVVLLNGLKDKGDYIQAFGPNRMSDSNEYGATGKGELFTVTYGNENGKYDMLTRTWQKANLNMTLTLSVGTFVGDDGKVWIDMLLKDSNGVEQCRLQRSLGLTEAEVGTGDIIIIPPIGVDGDYLTDGKEVTFNSFSEPYKKVEKKENF